MTRTNTRSTTPGAPRRLAAGLLALACCRAALAQGVDPTVRPNLRSPDCTTNGCHAETLAHTFQHGPTAVFDCRACHEDDDHAAHTFQIKTEGRGLCDFCHIDKAGTEGPVVHEPLAKGDCLECHDPHGSEHRKMLKFDSMGELCTSCHTETVHGSTPHEPVAQGDCTACHSPHTADHAGLLLQDRRSLCLSCHETLGEHLGTAFLVHEPLQGDCSECHLPHGSDHAGLLAQDTVGLCTSCHEEQLRAAEDAAFPHSVVLEDRACLNCHTPHASSQAALQFDDPVGACMACPGGPAEAAETTPAPPVNPAAPVILGAGAEQPSNPAPRASDLADNLPVSHGPVEDAQCGACHEVHGSDHSRLLTANYTDKFYEDFNENAYALCLSCHDRDMLLEDHTFEATRFRHGEQNLHALHVKGEQGRTCRACHNTHASNSTAMVRESSPYGQWMLPINFLPTEFGGSCAPGCHKAQTYTRGYSPDDVVPPTSDDPDDAPPPGEPGTPTDSGSATDSGAPGD